MMWRAVFRFRNAHVLLQAPYRASSTISVCARTATNMITETMDCANVAIHRRVLHNVAVFPKTSSIDEEPCVTMSYDGSQGDFALLKQKAGGSVELRALGVNESVAHLITALHRDFDSFYLASVDCVVIHRIGQHVLRINNSVNFKTSAGRALFIELNEVRQGTMMILDKVKATALTWIGVIVVVVYAAGVYGYTKTTKEETDKKFEEVIKVLGEVLCASQYCLPRDAEQ